MASAAAKNLEAISKAIDQHNRNCAYPAAEVRMNPFEVERLGWEEILGLPIVPDPQIGTGRFRIVCSRELDDGGLEEPAAVGQELQTIQPATTNEAPQRGTPTCAGQARPGCVWPSRPRTQGARRWERTLRA